MVWCGFRAGVALVEFLPENWGLVFAREDILPVEGFDSPERAKADQDDQRNERYDYVVCLEVGTE